MTGANFSHTQYLNGGVRFAPSPTGRFHVGNLRTAWIANVFAQTHKLPLIVRMEDIDKPRVLSGARAQQLVDMENIGVQANRVYEQSANHSRHWSLFQWAASQGLIYACDCSRKEVQQELAGLASAPHSAHAIYSGHCRARGSVEITSAKTESLAWRFKMGDPSGQQDFIIARTPPVSLAALKEDDFVPAYHWACAIDDFDGRYQLLVRAWDLEDSARLQRAIQTWLLKDAGADLQYPAIFHTALITKNDGNRLEKRTLGVTLPELSANGISPSELQRLFALSFDSKLLISLPAPNALLGETFKTLSLESLGLGEAN
jgi:glutamyl-tRNA synthetase